MQLTSQYWLINAQPQQASDHSASGLPRARPVYHTRLHPRSDRDLRRIVDDEGTQFIVWHWLCRGRHDKPRLGLDSALLVLPALRVCQEAVSGNEHPRVQDVDGLETECNKNFRGTSGGMEVEAAEILWNRSLERLNLQFTTMVSDGDSKSFKHLTNKRVYGDVELHKEECINHVAKRLGIALRKLAASGKKAGVTLGGRGFSRLTQATIVKLTAYHGKAVLAHRGNLPAMTKRPCTNVIKMPQNVCARMS